MYRVTYSSFDASYGPHYVEAEDEERAMQKAFGQAFTAREIRACARARELSDREIATALRRQEQED
jgi:hypothetical protein